MKCKILLWWDYSCTLEGARIVSVGSGGEIQTRVYDSVVPLLRSSIGIFPFCREVISVGKFVELYKSVLFKSSLLTI